MSDFHERMRAGSRIEHPNSRHLMGQHTNPVRAKRRAEIKLLGGIRRFKRLTQERYWSAIPF